MTATAALAQIVGWLSLVTVKSAVIIVFIALIQATIGRRFDARWRYALWLLVPLRLAMPFAPASSWSLFNLLSLETRAPQTFMIHNAVGGATRIEPVVSTAQTQYLRVPAALPLVRWLLAIWIIGALLLIARMLLASLRMQRAVNRERAATPPAGVLSAVLAEEAHRAGAPRLLGRMQILESDLVRTPALHGVLTPTLLIPRGMSKVFTERELRHVVLHELWHVRRFDVVINWILSVIQAIHWFNPFVWFASARIREERELACDELALSCLEEEERFSYGTTILKLLARFRAASPVPALVGIVNHKQKMRRRLSMIATYRNRTRFSAVFAAVLALVSLVALTDARAGQRLMMKTLDPATLAAHEKLSQKVNLSLNDATFAELLNAVQAQTGVTIAQTPDLATSNVQQARFTVNATNIPAHAVLMESLLAFGLAPQPGENGSVKIGSSASCATTITLQRHSQSESTQQSGDGTKKVVEQRIVIRENAGGPGDADTEALEHEHPAGPGEERHSVFVNASGGGHACQLDANGKLHREITMRMDDNGVKSEGKLTIDISAPPPASK